jgi:hypothetical protein
MEDDAVATIPAEFTGYGNSKGEGYPPIAEGGIVKKGDLDDDRMFT